MRCLEAPCAAQGLSSAREFVRFSGSASFQILPSFYIQPFSPARSLRFVDLQLALLWSSAGQ